MTIASLFNKISAVFQKHKIKHVLIGGFAINYYGVSRQTADIDFLITTDDFKKISKNILKIGYKVGDLQDNFIHLVNPQNILLDLDFMIIDNDTITKILKNSEKITIVGADFFVPSLLNLIALKLHSLKYNQKIRELKDMPDIINLIKINKVDYKSKEFRNLCKKYGSIKIYNKIRNYLK
ncbi:MAG: nucleotidyl transferase AbiEii/AbiGii toxin family protein [bacterium]